MNDRYRPDPLPDSAFSAWPFLKIIKWTYKRINQINKFINKQINKFINKQINKWKNKRIKREINKWIIK